MEKFTPKYQVEVLLQTLPATEAKELRKKLNTIKHGTLHRLRYMRYDDPSDVSVTTLKLAAEATGLPIDSLRNISKAKCIAEKKKSAV